ncbi:MAG: hypothetical protein SOW20_05755 [Berryella intestinalis]|uniref:hypothetical protein n=1 Tax=Berryella intestinalis TaxID=1531429 RepID=UPI002A75F49F|nr:hypothetical protein [Berryella intestinalis]MDY3129508.1 hypothetical protein [Berryella intestinalis]
MPNVDMSIESVLAMATAVVSIAGLMATLSRDDRARVRDREEDARSRARTDAKLDMVVADVSEMRGGMERVDAKLDKLMIEQTKLDTRLGHVEKRLDRLEGEHDKKCLVHR